MKEWVGLVNDTLLDTDKSTKFFKWNNFSAHLDLVFFAGGAFGRLLDFDLDDPLDAELPEELADPELLPLDDEPDPLLDELFDLERLADSDELQNNHLY